MKFAGDLEQKLGRGVPRERSLVFVSKPQVRLETRNGSLASYIEMERRRGRNVLDAAARGTIRKIQTDRTIKPTVEFYDADIH